MRFESSVKALKEQLLLLGFPEGLENALRSKICFQPEGFMLHHRFIKEADVVEFGLQFDFAYNRYAFSFYDAVLRKKIQLDDSVIELDRTMQAVNWNAIDPERVDAVTSSLNALASTEEGLLQSALLKLKHWAGTAVEELMPNLSSLRSKYEISQRFYFFDGEVPITIEEAYRFLCNRWMEKQLQLRKKQEIQTPPVETGGNSPASAENGMMRKIGLLPKKKRGQGRGIK